MEGGVNGILVDIVVDIIEQWINGSAEDRVYYRHNLEKRYKF